MNAEETRFRSPPPARWEGRRGDSGKQSGPLLRAIRRGYCVSLERPVCSGLELHFVGFTAFLRSKTSSGPEIACAVVITVGSRGNLRPNSKNPGWIEIPAFMGMKSRFRLSCISELTARGKGETNDRGYRLERIVIFEVISAHRKRSYLTGKNFLPVSTWALLNGARFRRPFCASLSPASIHFSNPTRSGLSLRKSYRGTHLGTMTSLCNVTGHSYERPRWKSVPATKLS
jgi:hypothetical protein